jgi:hypothetical protein
MTLSRIAIRYPDAELVAVVYLTAQLALIPPDPDVTEGVVVAATYPPAAPAARRASRTIIPGLTSRSGTKTSAAGWTWHWRSAA